MSHEKVVLVTGGTGLVGSAIQTIIQNEANPQNEKWHFLSSKEGNLCNIEETKKIFEKYKPTHVIHLAAKVGGLYFNMSYQLDFLHDNLLMNDNILKCCMDYNVKKVVSCLSTCIFPDKTTYPIDETMVHNGPPHPSNYGYSYAKRLIDVYNHAYFDQHGRNFTSIIPCNVFGPNDNFHPEFSHVIPGLIGKMFRTIEKDGNTPNTEFKILGSGKPLRQFIYSLDLARLIVWVVRSYEEIDPIILSVGEEDEISIKNVAESISRAFDFKGKLVFDANAPEGQFKKTASNAKLRRYLPDFQFTPIDEAIKTTVEWYKANVKTARN